MAYGNLEKSLRSMVDNESRKRDSILGEEIEKQFSILAAKGLLSSSVAVTSATELCLDDLRERVRFIYEKIRRIVNSQNISYTDELRKKAKELYEEFAEYAKCNCFGICTEAVEKINSGSVEGSLQRINHYYQIELKEVLNEMGVYFDELKNKTTFSYKGWFKRNATTIILIIIAAIVGFLIEKIPL